MALANTYSLIDHRAYSTAVTAIQLKAAAGKPLEIIRAWCSNMTSTTSAANEIALVRKSAAASVTSQTPLLLNPSDAAAGAVGGAAATGVNASAEGTNTDILFREGWNVLNGWLYLPLPEERIVVAGGGIIGLTFLTAPANVTYNVGIIFREVG